MKHIKSLSAQPPKTANILPPEKKCKLFGKQCEVKVEV